jgi:hypothetical protein
MAIIWDIVGDKFRSTAMNVKRDNFIRLAEGRVTRAIDSIRVIGNLSNTSNYEYTEEDSKRIIDALQSEITALKVQFKPKATSKKGFKLK